MKTSWLLAVVLLVGCQKSNKLMNPPGAAGTYWTGTVKVNNTVEDNVSFFISDDNTASTFKISGQINLSGTASGQITNTGSVSFTVDEGSSCANKWSLSGLAGGGNTMSVSFVGPGNGSVNCYQQPLNLLLLLSK